MRRLLHPLLGFLLSALPALAQSTSLSAVVLGTGGGAASSGNARAALSVGQPAIGSAQAAGSVGQLGFWHAAKPLQAGPPPTPTVTLGQVAGFKGYKFPVPLSLNAAGGLVAATFKISFDQAKLRVDAGDPRTTALTDGFILDEDVKQNQGRLAVSIAGAQGLPPGSGALIEIPVFIKNSAAIGDVIPLTLTEATLVYEDGADLVTVVPELVNGSLSVVEPGDINRDGALDLKDVVFVLRVVAGTLSSADPFDAAVADADHNGIVTLDDALFLLRGFTSAKLVPGSLPEPVAFDLPPFAALPGERVAVPLRVEALQAIAAMDLILGYDSSALRLEEVVPPEGLMVHNADSPGQVHLVGLNLQGLASVDGLLGELVFTALSPGEQSLCLDRAHLLDPDGNPFPVRRPGDPQGAAALPQKFALWPSFPNPFNPETAIRYDLAEAAQVEIAVYNALGQLVEELLRQHQPPGRHQVVWKTGDHAPGLYFLVVQAGSARKTAKMVLLK